MREIKFRSWLKERKEFIYEFTMNSINYSEGERSILSEYTGLKDANGVEIYEGDVISLEVIKGVKIKVPVKFEKGSFNIHEIPGGYGFRDTAYPLGTLFLRDFGIEVIGNIYENPELLEVVDGDS